jgi:hypothetical protein
LSFDVFADPGYSRYKMESIGDAAVDDTAHIADIPAALKLGDDDMELDISSDDKLEDEAVEVL